MLLSNPGNGELLSTEERKYTRDILHAYAEIVRKGESMFSQFCESRGVPGDVCIRAMIQIALHRAGTNAAHLLTMHKVDDLLVGMEGQALAERLKEALKRQMPLSRETEERSAAKDTRP